MIGIWFPVGKQGYALVDRDVYGEVVKHKWCFFGGRIVSNNKGEPRTYLHQFVIFLDREEYVGDVDHRERDQTDNRRESLRVCNRTQNQGNRKVGEGRKYKGV